MRIKKLELVGFKSFKDRTVIHFDKGITGIVGPNGCGKSNIVDALVWVMGEMSAKHLRGSSMEDVIFAGAEGFAPVGMAEVSLTLENDGGPFPAKYLRFSEVMITRRLHRSGESEYLINSEQARLRDIQEIFMDTGAGSKGFSIIEQGAIGKIIVAKPEERRTLIEEAAGITKFKVRKRESQRKLTSTDQNLVRLQDIIGEQKRQLDSLQRQAQRAERYRKVKDEVTEIDLWVASKKYLGLHEEVTAAEAEFDEAKQQEATLGSDLSQLESDLEKVRLEVSEKEIAVTEKQTENQQRQQAVVAKENEIRELGFEIEQARRSQEMAGSILNQYTVRQQALEKDQTRLTEKVEGVREEEARLSSEYATKNEAYLGVQQKIHQADGQLTEKRQEMLAVSQSESHLDARLVSVQAQCEEAQERLETSRSVLFELTEKQNEFEARRTKVFNQLESERQLQLDIMKDVENFEENFRLLEEQAEQKQEEVSRFKDELNECTSRLYGLENLHANFEGFQEGVRNVMLWQRQKMEEGAEGQLEASAPSFQPMSEVVEVPAEYELAMEAALGQRLQMLLSDKTDQSLEALDYLKTNKSGRSSFLSQELAQDDSVEAQEALDQLKEQKGFKALLNDVVSVPDRYRKQVAYFLSDIVIVSSIRDALALRAQYPNHTFVTLDGDTLSTDGVLTGGTGENAESGVLKRRREIKELSQKREEAAGKLSLAQASLKKLQAQVDSVGESLQQAKTRHTEKEIQIAEFKKDFERAENEFENAQQAVRRQEEECSSVESQVTRHEETRSELSERLDEVREKRLRLNGEVEQLEKELIEARSGIDELQEEVTRLKVNSASKSQELEGLDHQLKMVENSLAEVNEQLSQMSEQSQRSTESLSSNQVAIEESKVELESLIHQAEVVEKHLAEAKNAYEETATMARQLEEKVSQALHSRSDFTSRMNNAQLRLEQGRLKEQYLIDHVNEKYMKDLHEVAPQYQEAEGDLEAKEKELEELRSKLQRMGEVNLSAIEEYDDLVSRYEFLSQQHQDLLTSKDQLRKVIDRINRICSRRFKETFEQVNERFTKVFPVLFGGGEAQLILIEDHEKGEMGIDIVARPPGKKLQNVSLLSGGEKALTAVSLIFSIFLVKPSPFCLLDEVDAPLDDANVFRFNDLVKEMAKRSQIIVVTHNKYTMKVNNKLFGVTMENKGVSKMVSVSLEEAEQVAMA